MKLPTALAGKPVLLRLRCGVTSSGSYIYERVGEPLRLSPAGANELDESIGTAERVRTTGHLAFTARQRLEGFLPHAPGHALVPIVSEAARIYRHQVQLVPFARVRRALRPDGPAAHLYPR